MRSTMRCHPATCRTAARFLGEERGSITVFGIMGFVMCVVVIGLAFDVGRVMGIHTEVSSFADRAALAAAQELDGRPGAIRDAVDAAQALGNGKRMTLTNGADVTITRIEFRENQDDQNPLIAWDVLNAGNRGFPPDVNPNDGEFLSARFATVITSGAQEGFLFIPVGRPIGGSSMRGVTVSPTATAGFQREACNIAPIMVCNPADRGGGAAYSPMERDRGNTETFRLQGKNGPDRNDYQEWGPGTYSLLRTGRTTPSAEDLRDLVRQDHPGTACFGRMVRTERGLDYERQNGNGNGNGNNNNDNNERMQIGRGFDERYDRDRREFPVAIVNCAEHSAALERGDPVPVETYGLMTITNSVDYSDQEERIVLRRSGTPNVTDGHIHEFPVLVK